jgi:hypothetical protein
MKLDVERKVGGVESGIKVDLGEEIKAEGVELEIKVESGIKVDLGAEIKVEGVESEIKVEGVGSEIKVEGVESEIKVEGVGSEIKADLAEVEIWVEEGGFWVWEEVGPYFEMWSIWEAVVGCLVWTEVEWSCSLNCSILGAAEVG